ncbi:hypothetical protein HNR65_003564 [Desulfosalsimonas propionicica]|uniref:Uncharacterized protein n=1 Tax=Desulfosalsimonas propionicica TaxID=332175 RepID=A0A7W0HME2_9BACT|nr:hypothetical protein [Desulfosalsimonas propionicica]MBA2883202.1 hypothetical protein [Desulfosalsimonas propionicica]
MDADTGEPIENVVVMGYWRINYFPFMFIGAPSHYYDAREAVTDEEGYFTLPGLGLWLYPGYLNSPSISVYKKGYKNRGWDKDKRVIPLRKLDEEESIYRINLDIPLSDNHKIKRYLQEIDHYSLK